MAYNSSIPNWYKTLAGKITDLPDEYKSPPNRGNSSAGLDSAIHFVRAAYVPSSGASADGPLGNATNVITRANSEAQIIAHNFSRSV